MAHARCMHAEAAAHYDVPVLILFSNMPGDAIKPVPERVNRIAPLSRTQSLRGTNPFIRRCKFPWGP